MDVRCAATGSCSKYLTRAAFTHTLAFGGSKGQVGLNAR